MADLLTRSQWALHMVQNQFAAFLGVSDRTMRRWMTQKPHLPPRMLRHLAGAVHEKDPALARRLAAAHGESLKDLAVGLSAEERIAADIVHAAADVAGQSLREMRPVVLAAFAQARASGVTIEAAHALLVALSAKADGDR
jgi:hypothetical protein